MYIDNDEFGGWMQKLYAKLEELCKDVRVLRNADRVLPEDDNLLDNQDLCLLFKVSINPSPKSFPNSNYPISIEVYSSCNLHGLIYS